MNARKIVIRGVVLGSALTVAATSFAQYDPWPMYGGNAQHTAMSFSVAQPLKRILWQFPIDMAPQYSGADLLIHYTPPMLSQSGTLVVPVKTSAASVFDLRAYDSSSGGSKWSISTDYRVPPAGWTPVCPAVLTHVSPRARSTTAVVAASGGRVLVVPNIDLTTPSVTSLCFYGIKYYEDAPAGYDANIFINTPFVADHLGNVFFGYRATGDTTLHLASGIAKVPSSGRSAIYRSVSQMTGGLSTGYVATNCAPALSNDGRTLYFATTGGQPYLVGVDAVTLEAKYVVALFDPVSHQPATVIDEGTASPMIGPDGGVFYGILENPWYSNHDRGYMLHFDSSLHQLSYSGDFGWDDTASVVPKDALPKYVTNSPYLILTKYNNYIGIGGDGHNRVAILDPFQSQIDPQTGSTVMKEVISVVGVTPDGDGVGGKVREWCINSAAIDVKGSAAILNCEDGLCYRWDFLSNTLSPGLYLSAGIGQAYTSTMIGPNGRSFAISNGILFCIGSR